MSKGNNWIGMDKMLAQDFKSIKREFSRIEAMFSYSVDIDNGLNGTISGYSAQWGWSRNKVRRFINCIRTDEGHLKDSKRTVEGHPIHFIDNSLMSKKDRQRTDEGQAKDTCHDTTIEPDPKPDPKIKKNIKKKPNFKSYLQQKIIQNNFIETKDKIFEFYNYRMETKIKGKKQPYATEKGIDGLFTCLNGCRDSGMIVSECLEKAMQDEWLKPDPSYFNNNRKKQVSRQDSNKQACLDFINGVQNG